jgi:hypothetical protein
MATAGGSGCIVSITAGTNIVDSADPDRRVSRRQAKAAVVPLVVV